MTTAASRCSPGPRRRAAGAGTGDSPPVAADAPSPPPDPQRHPASGPRRASTTQESWWPRAGTPPQPVAPSRLCSRHCEADPSPARLRCGDAATGGPDNTVAALGAGAARAAASHSSMIPRTTSATWTPPAPVSFEQGGVFAEQQQRNGPRSWCTATGAGCTCRHRLDTTWRSGSDAQAVPSIHGTPPRSTQGTVVVPASPVGVVEGCGVGVGERAGVAGGAGEGSGTGVGVLSAGVFGAGSPQDMSVGISTAPYADTRRAPMLRAASSAAANAAWKFRPPMGPCRSRSSPITYRPG